MYNGLTVASWALTDMLPAQGGFCCIPGSHKSNFSCPSQLKVVKNAPECMKGHTSKGGRCSNLYRGVDPRHAALGGGPSAALNSGKIQSGPRFVVTETVFRRDARTDEFGKPATPNGTSLCAWAEASCGLKRTARAHGHFRIANPNESATLDFQGD